MEAHEETIARMSEALIHRGPDDSGCWTSESCGVALGHRRLAIVDLTQAGHQPMRSASGRHVIAFNGEIYNWREIRKELDVGAAAIAWRGHSDTEVALAAIERWGVHGALERFVGMFAFAIWDSHREILTLARDRMGEKPLYYGWSGTSFLFASELKALTRHPAFSKHVNGFAVAQYFRYACVPAPQTIFDGVWKLPAGCTATLTNSQFHAGSSPAVAHYWRLSSVIQTSTAADAPTSALAAREALDRTLRQAVADQMVADVPLGAFLSGGVDSSTISALMQSQSPRPIKTFSIGFTEQGYNEAIYAKAVARHLGTDHTELYLSPQQAQSVIPRLPDIYDEPFADSSQIPTLLVSQMAREHVTVALTGDAGDELFGGYNRYAWGRRMKSLRRWAPHALRQAAAHSLTALPPERWDGLAALLRRLPGISLNIDLLGDKLHKLAGLLPVDSDDSLYRSLVSFWDLDVLMPAKRLQAVSEDWIAQESVPSGLDIAQGMMYRDAVGYLPDDILVKVDRAAMSVSLETRVPFLDHRVVEFAWRLPSKYRTNPHASKWLLREVLYQYVPKALIERPKMGFSIPIGAWLRGPLRDWAESLLGEDRLRRQGLLNCDLVRHRWGEHLSGSRNWQHHLWIVLMFQSWHARWMEGSIP